MNLFWIAAGVVMIMGLTGCVFGRNGRNEAQETSIPGSPTATQENPIQVVTTGGNSDEELTNLMLTAQPKDEPVVMTENLVTPPSGDNLIDIQTFDQQEQDLLQILDGLKLP